VVPRSAALYLGVVQFLFATTWTIYVIYLPQLAAQAGIDKRWVPWILLADQVIFAVTDVPFAGASAGLLLGCAFAWAVTSSALRSPPWALMSRYAATPSVPWLSTLVLTGTAIAGALAPYLGITLRNVDPRVPFVVSTLTLLAAVGGLVWVERRLAAAVPQPAGEAEPPFDLASPEGRRLVVVFFAALAVMAVGFQVHFSLNSAPQYLRYAGRESLQYLMPVFWIGFNVLMFPAAAFVKRFGPFAVMAAAAAAGGVATLGAALAPSLETLVLAQFLAGGCWGAMSTAIFSAAIAFGRTRREGALLGGMFAVLALAAMLRILAVASELVQAPSAKALLPWAPHIGWLMAALLLAALLGAARRRAV
jgi:hypothetical protein